VAKHAQRQHDKIAENPFVKIRQVAYLRNTVQNNNILQRKQLVNKETETEKERGQKLVNGVLTSADTDSKIVIVVSILVS
jgi:hypothetical protein